MDLGCGEGLPPLEGVDGGGGEVDFEGACAVEQLNALLRAGVGEYDYEAAVWIAETGVGDSGCSLPCGFADAVGGEDFCAAPNVFGEMREGPILAAAGDGFGCVVDGDDAAAGEAVTERAQLLRMPLKVPAQFVKSV